MNQYSPDPTELQPRLTALVDRLMNSFDEGKYIDRENHYRQPDEKEVLRVLDELRQIVFQGFFTATRYKVYTARNHITMLLEDVLFLLTKQIALALPSDEARFGELNEKEAEALGRKLALDFLDRLPAIRALLETDVEAAFDGDPAASSRDEIIYSYPGLYAIFTSRIAHQLYLLGVPLIPRMMTEYAHRETGIDIHPGASIGSYFFIDHGTGIVIGETTRIGDHVKLYQGVTLGALSTRGGRALNNVRRHPTIEDYVTLYAGATVLGGDTVIGQGSVIGGNTFITSSIPAGTKVSVKNQELILSGGNVVKREDEDSWFYII